MGNVTNKTKNQPTHAGGQPPKAGKKQSQKKPLVYKWKITRDATYRDCFTDLKGDKAESVTFYENSTGKHFEVKTRKRKEKVTDLGNHGNRIEFIVGYKNGADRWEIGKEWNHQHRQYRKFKVGSQVTFVSQNKDTVTFSNAQGNFKKGGMVRFKNSRVAQRLHVRLSPTQNASGLEILDVQGDRVKINGVKFLVPKSELIALETVASCRWDKPGYFERLKPKRHYKLVVLQCPNTEFRTVNTMGAFDIDDNQRKDLASAGAIIFDKYEIPDNLYHEVNQQRNERWRIRNASRRGGTSRRLIQIEAPAVHHNHLTLPSPAGSTGMGLGVAAVVSSMLLAGGYLLFRCLRQRKPRSTLPIWEDEKDI